MRQMKLGKAFALMESGPVVLVASHDGKFIVDGRKLDVAAADRAPGAAAQCVRGMAGKNRVPELVRLADRLARSRLSGSPNSQSL